MTRKVRKKISVIILMNKFHIGANILVNKIINDPHIDIKGIIVRDVWKSNNNNSKLSLLNSFLSWGKKNGYIFILSLTILTILHFIKLLMLDIMFLFFVIRNVTYLKTVERLAFEKSIPLKTTNNINDKETEKYIKNLKPDIILSNNFHQIIKENILNIPKLGCINIHPGKLPLYRGFLPHFWHMVEDSKDAGVTLHKIDNGVDTGAILLEDRVDIKKGSSLYEVWQNTAEVGSKLLKKYFKKLSNGQTVHGVERKVLKSRQFPFPNKEAFSKFKNNGYKLFKFKELIDL